MRLLDVHTLKLKTFYNQQIPPYAILSHTWLEDEHEVTFAQIQNPAACAYIAGFQKITFLCEQAKSDGYSYAWIDTCCIDKTSSAELSEAINSMFEWYKNSEVCYVWLMDDDDTEIFQSRWWTRAWTLQELLAPKHVKFFNKESNFLKTKKELAQAIEANTGIHTDVLLEPSLMQSYSAAQRMAWASSRNATRTEDTAYSLLGIFDVNMPLLYGEGSKAFIRLQEAILRRDQDQTLFVWSFETRYMIPFVLGASVEEIPSSKTTLLASSPQLFRNSGKIVMLDTRESTSEIRDYGGAHYLDIYIQRYQPHKPDGSIIGLALLPCLFTEKQDCLVGICLARKKPSDNTYIREGAGSFLIHKNDFPWFTYSTVRIISQSNQISRSPRSPSRSKREILHGLETIVVENRSAYIFHSELPPRTDGPLWKPSGPRGVLSLGPGDLRKSESMLCFCKGSRMLSCLILTFRSTDYPNHPIVKVTKYKNVPKEHLSRKLDSHWEAEMERGPESFGTLARGTMDPASILGRTIGQGQNWSVSMKKHTVYGETFYIVSLKKYMGPIIPRLSGC